jgi:hypothetical protein
MQHNRMNKCIIDLSTTEPAKNAFFFSEYDILQIAI